MSQNEWQDFITADRVMELHAESIKRYSKAALRVGNSHRDCVEEKLGNAWTAERYSASTDMSRSGLCFAGYLMFYLANGNCFPEGNKRVGWASAMAVLAELGLSVQATTREAEEFLLRIVAHDVADGNEVVIWLAQRLQAESTN